MTELTNYQSVNISTIMANLDRYKYNPSMIQRVALDLLDEITNGQVDIVDPTNPFVFLLESSAINAALCINENHINLRKQYAALAQTEEELYLHMSDKDFINRFAVPSETNFTFVIQINDMYSKMVYDTEEKCGKLIIPRDTEFTVDSITFTLQYPIVIRRFDNGIVQVSYDTEYMSPLQTLTSNIIDYTLRRDNNLVDWLSFKIPVKQFKIQTTFFPVQLSSLFSYTVKFTDQYYYCRVFYKNNNTGNLWNEMLVTHTDQVFDPFKATAILKVFSGQLNVSIPKIYFTSGLISGDIRIDVYTTKGELTINLANYKLASFSNKLKAIDEVRDINEYTNALVNVSYFTYSDEFISGGTNGIDFETLRNRVIFNSIGDRQLPITPDQIYAFVENNGFELVKNVDVVTNRIFLATQKLPKPINTKLLTPANIGINTFITNIQTLSTIDRVVLNNDRQTILSNNLFKNNNGVVSILSKLERDALQALPKSEFINIINSNYYLYNPFYYVLDNSTNEFEVRAYDLDHPVASNLSFIEQNQTLQLPVNTGQYTLEKIAQGYKLTIVTKSGNFYKQLENDLVGMQLAYYPVGESNLAYINGTYLGLSTTDERVFEFILETNYDLNKSHQLAITNSHMFDNEHIVNWINLTLDVYLFHTTSSITEDYVASKADQLIGRFMLPPMSACVTHESLTLNLGDALSNLWTRCRSFATGLEYQRHVEDIPMLYDRVVYDTDPVTGSIFTFDTNGDIQYLILHNIGDPVLDESGNPVYRYRKGDVVLDNDGKPVVSSGLEVNKEIDLLFVDGKYYFATDSSFVSYQTEIAAVLNTWITENLIDIQNVLLEQTKIYFYPKTTIGMVNVYVEMGIQDTIASEQSLIVDLYVGSQVYNDLNIRQDLSDITVEFLDEYINKTTINITEIEDALKTKYGSSVKAFDIRNLGGSKNYKVVSLATEHNRLSLKKNLVQQQDGSLIIKEDVAINFYNVDKPVN